VRHRSSFTYVTATSTDGTELTLCRLRYVGSVHHWQVGIYGTSHDDYAESIFPTGLPVGTREDGPRPRVFTNIVGTVAYCPSD